MPHKTLQHVDRQRENDRRVMFRCDCAQSLQIPELERRRRFGDHIRRFFQRPTRFVFAFRCDYLKIFAIFIPNFPNSTQNFLKIFSILLNFTQKFYSKLPQNFIQNLIKILFQIASKFHSKFSQFYSN